MTDSTKMHSRKVILAVVVALAAAGCARLQPLDLPDEVTAPPAEAVLWERVAAAAPGQSWLSILNDGPTALDWRLRAIDSATEVIDLQTFLWKFDTAGTLVLDHLVRAADRGVIVRILIDDSFLMHQDATLLALAAHPNVEYRIYNPFTRRAGSAATRQLLNLAEFSRLDHRMHNKSMVVDNRVAIVGGRNQADEYFGLADDGNFRDLDVILGGDVVLDVSRRFDEYWNDDWAIPVEDVAHTKASSADLAAILSAADLSGDLHSELSDTELAAAWIDLAAAADSGKFTLYADRPPAVNPAAPEDIPIDVANELLEIFRGAQSEIVIITAYLIPTPDLEGAVAEAVKRGVRVRILTNSLQSNNHLTAHSAYRNHINTLLVSGAELHEVRIDARDRERYMLSPIGRKKLALHAKALIIDNDKLFIGSANLDPRSLRINTEMGFLIESEILNAKARGMVETDFSVANAWRLDLQDDGKVVWVGDGEVLDAQPANSFMHRIEDWFFSLLPLESEL